MTYPQRVETGPWGPGRPGRASHPVGGAQAGSGGWAGAETLARPSSCRRNSELAGGWLPGTSGAAPWPPPPAAPASSALARSAGSFARTPRPPASPGPSPKRNCDPRLQQEMALKPSLPRKIVRAGLENRVHPTSPIWGSEGQHRAAAAIQSASQGPRITLSLAAISQNLGYLPLSSAALPPLPFYSCLGILLKCKSSPVRSPGITPPCRSGSADLPDLIPHHSCPRTFALAVPTAWYSLLDISMVTSFTFFRSQLKCLPR